ncbi:hypothetical protein GCM10011571_28170 [Marinithermofilum abyssi]|uniref:Uncharacterized protein n=1 Tax=Marinithermofilum abyssi TaxID=1571185 RepID=A0A8J2VD94_9BACL|nr:hypothetical protein [Marinithermofilum abyssi]GGE24400.1 hypothetical protein GCM10011571_28170 [Marinithermofilum abyssi]
MNLYMGPRTYYANVNVNRGRFRGLSDADEILVDLIQNPGRKYADDMNDADLDLIQQKNEAGFYAVEYGTKAEFRSGAGAGAEWTPERWVGGLGAGVLLAAGVLPGSMSSSSAAEETKSSLYQRTVNLGHLNHLQDEVNVNGVKMAVTRIYSEYPDYGWVGDADEGIACVDDTARATVVYLQHFEETGDRSSLERAQKALNFILYMQAEDGEFYNFVFKDYSINREGPTSYKSMGWWAARGMWAMGHGYRVFQKEDPAFAERLRKHFLLANEALQRKINAKYGDYRSLHGAKVPAWMDEYDALSNALLGLTEFYRAEPLPVVKESMVKLGDGLSWYQLGSFSRYPYQAHMEWSGSIQLWHAWGSTQPMALARAGQVLKRKDYIRSAQKAADGLYAHLLTSGMIKEMAPTPSYYEQIAYGANRMVQGLLAVGEATGNRKYDRMAGLAASWFFGNNSADSIMYDVETGRGYDGIVAPGQINRNAGAESTIEALMAVQAVTSNPEAAAWMRAKRVKRHSYRILEAEQGETAAGKPEIINPESSWNGEALYSGKLVEMKDGDALRFTLDWGVHEAVQIEAAFEKQTESEGAGELVVTVNNETAVRHDTGGSPDEDYLWRDVLSRAELKKGTNTITVTYRGKKPLILDNIFIQPVKSYTVYQLPNQEIGQSKTAYWDSIPQRICYVAVRYRVFDFPVNGIGH